MLKKVAKASLVAGSCATIIVAWDICRKRRSKLHSMSSLLNHYFLNQTLRCIGSFASKKLEKDTINCMNAQEETLMSLIQENAHTAYGTNHHFSEIHNRDDFVRLHPLTHYDHYAAYIDRVADGEQNVMTKAMPAMLGVTSGTSGQCKLMPTSNRLFRSFFVDGIAVLYHYMFQTYPSMNQLQKDMKFFYTPKWRTSPGGLLIGPNSSTPKSSKNILSLYSTPPEAYGILTEPEARYIHLLFGLSDRDLGMIEANFCSLVYTAFQDLRSKWPQLVEDIRSGMIDPDLNIDPELKAVLNSHLKADPKRANELEREFQKGFEGITKRVWPHCGLVFCVTTGANEIYKELMEDRELKGIPMFSPLYGATEGLFGLNIEPLNPKRTYLLTPRTMFFEFIPIDQVDEESPQTLFMNQVKEGEVYEMVITNLSGFYRYRFGDVVRIESFHNSCPKVEFMYRKGQLLNIRGEKTDEKLFYSALMDVSSQWENSSVVDYCCAESILLADAEGKSSPTPSYIVFVELDGRKILTEREKQMLDEALCEKSYVYKSFRQKRSIGPAQVYSVSPGSFAALKQFLIAKSDTSANQFKVPRVIKHPAALTFLEERIIKA